MRGEVREHCVRSGPWAQRIPLPILRRDFDGNLGEPSLSAEESCPASYESPSRGHRPRLQLCVFVSIAEHLSRRGLLPREDSWLNASSPRTIASTSATSGRSASRSQVISGMFMAILEGKLGDARFIELAQSFSDHAIILVLGRAREW